MKKLYTFYVVHCSVDERKYVGCTSYSLEKRWGDHISATKTGARTPFHKEMHKIGIENFKPEIICQEYHDRKSAVIREEEFISHYNSRDNGFNGSWSRVGESNGWYGKGASNDNFTDPSKNPSKGVIQKTAKKVDVEGVTYPSIAHAARAYDIDHTLVTYRVKSKSQRFKNWNYHGDWLTTNPEQYVGAGDEKFAQTIKKKSASEGKKVKQTFETKLPALGALQERLRKMFKEHSYGKGGFIEVAGGAWLYCDSEHKLLNYLLMGSEAQLQQEAVCWLNHHMRKEGIIGNQILSVHK